MADVELRKMALQAQQESDQMRAALRDTLKKHPNRIVRIALTISTFWGADPGRLAKFLRELPDHDLSFVAFCAYCLLAQESASDLLEFAEQK